MEIETQLENIDRKIEGYNEKIDNISSLITTLIHTFQQNQLPNINMSAFIFIFILLKFFSCSLSVFLASETYIFSYEFRAIKQNLSVLKRAPITYKFIFTFAKTIGGILIVNFIYCLAVKSL